MPVQIIMDRHGDSRYFFDADNNRSLADAENRFNNLMKKGFRAVAPEKRGQPGRLLKNFDAREDETIFIPPLQGG